MSYWSTPNEVAQTYARLAARAAARPEAVGAHPPLAVTLGAVLGDLVALALLVWGTVAILRWAWRLLRRVIGTR